jgi:hypothetical protein
MAVGRGVPMITTIAGARAAVQAIAALRGGAWSVAAVQDYGAGGTPARGQLSAVSDQPSELTADS